MGIRPQRIIQDSEVFLADYRYQTVISLKEQIQETFFLGAGKSYCMFHMAGTGGEISGGLGQGTHAGGWDWVVED